jgi:hypothetical protein
MFLMPPVSIVSGLTAACAPPDTAVPVAAAIAKAIMRPIL